MVFSYFLITATSAKTNQSGLKGLFWAGCLLCLLLWCSPARALDHIAQRAWVEDASGQLPLEAIRQLPEQRFEGVLSRGFGSGIVWVRLRIDPTISQQDVDSSDRLVLRMRPVYLDDIQIFDPLAPGQATGVTGDRVHPRGQAFEGLDFMLPIARGDAPRDIWLRLASTSTRQISVQAVPPNDLQKLTQIQQLMFALYIGVILIFMVWGIVYWLFSRELVIGAFALKQAAALVFALGSLGYTRVFWPAQWPAQWLDTTTTLFSILAVSAAIYFHVVLLSEFSPPRWLTQIHRGLLSLLPVKLLLVLAVHEPRVALEINMFEVLLMPVIFLFSVFMATGWSKATPAHQRPVLARWVAVGFYVLLFLILQIAALPGLGLTRGGEIPLYLVQAHGLVTAFLILLMLQYRAHMQQKQQRETALALERSQLQAQQERSIREEQEKLLAMLAHEIKTPLATMHMRLDANAQGSREIRQAIRDMNAVIERCLQTTQLGDRQLQAHVARVDVVQILKDAVSSCAQPQRISLASPPELNLQTDPQLLFIVLSNLLENACKYAAPDSAIEVKLFSTGGDEGTPAMACVDVANRPGQAGWPEADKVFDKYYRSPHARRQAGTGLGLYLVQNLMQVLGGRIDYLPESERIRFRISLPSGSSTH